MVCPLFCLSIAFLLNLGAKNAGYLHVHCVCDKLLLCCSFGYNNNNSWRNLV